MADAKTSVLVRLARAAVLVRLARAARRRTARRRMARGGRMWPGRVARGRRMPSGQVARGRRMPSGRMARLGGVAPLGGVGMRGAVARLGGVAVLGAAAAVAVRRLILHRRWRPRLRRQDGRWHSITVNRRPEDVSTAIGPAPLEELGLEVDIRYRPAPGGRGTEVSVCAPHGGLAQQRKIRAALRQAKQLWETGEVLQPDEPGTAQRTLLNRPLAYATRHAREDGRL